MAFKNIEEMARQVHYQAPYANEYTNTFLAHLSIWQGKFTEAQVNEIVRLFNIHCMPAKFEVSKSEYAPKKKRK